MRALLVTPDFPPARGGIQILVDRLVAETPDIEWDVVTLRDRQGRPPPLHPNARILRVGGRGGSRRRRILQLNAAAVRLGLAIRPDVVVAGHLVAGPALSALQRLTRTTTVLWLHGKELHSRPTVTRAAIRAADQVVVVSRHTRELALAFGASPERVTIIHPGVDAVVAPERDPASRRVLVIARLDDHYKGHDVLIRAVPLVRSRVPGVVVDIVGDGHLRSWLEGLVAQSGVADSVVFHGAVDDGTRDALLASARVFCLPSRLEADGSGGEGFGIVFLEAAAYGVPVVAGAAGGTLDAVANGVTGLLVDPTDHVAVADALVRLLTDDELNERCGRAGRARVIEFSWAAQGRAAEALLRSTT